MLIYRIVFDPETHFRFIKECIHIDRNLHHQFNYDGNRIPLPQWFIHQHNTRITSFNVLENFPNYIQSVVEKQSYSILKELQKWQLYKQRRCPSFIAELIRYTLLQRYTSKQVYKLLLEKFPLPSFSLLEKIERGGIESITPAKSLVEKGHLSQDHVWMVDEIYHKKEHNFIVKSMNFIKE